MASESYTVVEPAMIPSAESPFGERDDKILKGCFPMSPIMYSNNPTVRLTDDQLRQTYYDTVKDDSVSEKRGQVPSMSQVAQGEAGGEGKPSVGMTLGDTDADIPAQKWPVPNPNSSYNSNSSPGAAPAFQDESTLVQGQNAINYGSGPPSPVSPHKTTESIRDQDFRLGRLTLGSSS